ncbi:MAG: LemA family protein [Candidatus Woesearchaeota archaeon]
MKKANSSLDKWKPVLIILAVVLVLGLIFGGIFNSLVSKDEAVNRAWADVEAQYQRRADLIPNLVSTVKGFASQEKEVLTEVTEARTSWQNADSEQEQISAANEMDGALSRLLVTVEAYPELKSNENFLALQDQLEGTENRISVARQRYNEAVRSYNTKVRSFPTNILAGMYGFETREMFEADQGADDAPDVDSMLE